MPKTTKETNEISKNLNSKKVAKSGKIASTAKKTTTAKPKSTKTTSATKKTTTQKKVVASKKAIASKETPPSKKATSSKKVSNKKTPLKKVTNSKTKTSINVLEYYDLPYRYNQTVVKMLSQTPKTLFVYWDISDIDRQNFINQYGEGFFENTKPVLIIHNVTMNYSFEIEINDFANCWYFNINDESCEYLVELGRRPKTNNIYIPNNYLHVASSNKIESPNGHILFEKQQKTLFYRNVKTNESYSKDVANLQFIKRFGRIYNIYETYKEIYKKEEFLDINNPTS